MEARGIATRRRPWSKGPGRRALLEAEPLCESQIPNTSTLNLGSILLHRHRPRIAGQPNGEKPRFMRHSWMWSCAILIAVGCSTRGAVDTPSALPLPAVVATPLKGQATILAVPTKRVGNIQPVYVSIANGTDGPLEQSQGEIFLKGKDGNRVPAVPLPEAVEQAGGAPGLVSTIGTAAAYGIPAAAASAATGAASAAAVYRSTWAGAFHGSVIGAGAGLIGGAAYGVWKAHAAAEQRAQEQIETFTLKPGTVPPNGTASGYVFYPPGVYQQVEAVLGNTETQTSLTLVNTVSR